MSAARAVVLLVVVAAAAAAMMGVGMGLLLLPRLLVVVEGAGGMVTGLHHLRCCRCHRASLMSVGYCWWQVVVVQGVPVSSRQRLRQMQTQPRSLHVAFEGVV